MNDEEKRNLDRKRNDLRWVVSTPQGRRFYWELMSTCHPFVDKYVESIGLTNYLKGARSVGLNMYHDLLDADPDSFTRMLNENKAKNTREEIKVARRIKEKVTNPTKIDSPVLPNTETEMSNGG